MRFAVHFEDNEGHADKRQEFMRDHLAFLKNNADKILSAGPLFDATTGAGAGGQWVVEASNASDVQNLVEQDPFFSTGLRKAITILKWHLVFEHGEVMK